jgi:hypothetical protein
MNTLSPIIPAVQPGAVRAALVQARAVLGEDAPDLLVVNDPQRATATPAVLRAMSGVFDVSRTRVLVATGSHRFAPEVRRAFAAGLPGAAELAWHNAHSVDLARLDGPDGWYAHPWLVQARTVLAIGSVEPHYFAGFTGAHKTLTIGCAAYDEIERNHAGALDPACRPCRPDASPVHAGIVRLLAAVTAGRRVAAVNLMQVGDAIIDAAGGAPLDALDALAPCVKSAYLRHIPQPAHALVAEVTGALACSFYQAEKGIKNCEAAVRDGGTIILVAACPEGVGQSAFTMLLRDAPTYAAAMAEIRRRGYRLGDHKAVRLRYLTDPACRGVRVFTVCPGLSAADAALLGVQPAASVAAALAVAGVSPDDPGVYRIEDAANTCVG